MYVAWSDSGSQTASRIDALFRRSIDGGATFNDAVNLSADAGAGSGSGISIAVKGNNVYIAWDDYRSANDDIQYRWSIDNGATFESAINLSNNVGRSSDPRIATLDNYVYIIWNDDSTGDPEIVYRRSIDNGATFESAINLSNTNGDSDLPTITAPNVLED